MKKIFLLTACAALGLGSCTKDDMKSDSRNMTVSVHVVSHLQTRSAATDEENTVGAFDLFVFDAGSGLLESARQNIDAAEVSAGDLAGEKKIGQVELELKDGKAKNILAIANKTDNNVSLPEIKVGETRYADMLSAVAVLEGNTPPGSPFVMSGYINNVNAADNPTAHISLQRCVTKLSVTNLSADNGLEVSSVQLKQAADRVCLFQEGQPESGIGYVDHEPVDLSAGSPAVLYTFPQTAEKNRMILTVSGVLNGRPFTQDLEVKPMQDGAPQDMERNALYTIKITAQVQSVSLQVALQQGNEWADGGDIAGEILAEEPVGTILFNGLYWMDRNLGATSADLENDWDNAIGKFYQWGRNTAFGIANIETISGPVTADEAAANQDKFITKMNGDWLDGTDDTRWQSVESQPCPEGFRLPTIADFNGIFPPAGVLVNMYNAPVNKTETLSAGNFPAQYWGDRSKTIYGIKKQGSADAYYMRWTYMTTSAGNGFIRISRWPADENATFTGKELSDIQDIFTALGDAREVLDLPAAGSITGSSGTYSAGSPGGYYWTSSLNGKGAHRAEFTSAKMIAGDTYNSRVSGHSIRCVRRE